MTTGICQDQRAYVAAFQTPCFVFSSPICTIVNVPQRLALCASSSRCGALTHKQHHTTITTRTGTPAGGCVPGRDANAGGSSDSGRLSSATTSPALAKTRLTLPVSCAGLLGMPALCTTCLAITSAATSGMAKLHTTGPAHRQWVALRGFGRGIASAGRQQPEGTCHRPSHTDACR